MSAIPRARRRDRSLKRGVGLGGGEHECSEPVGLPSQWSDQRLPRLEQDVDLCRRLRDGLAGQDERHAVGQHERVRHLGRDLGDGSLWIQDALLERLDPGDPEAPRFLVPKERRDHRTRSELRDGLHRLPEDLVHGMELRQSLREPKQGGRCLGRFTLRLEQLGVVEGHRGVGGQDLQQPAVVLVELAVAEHRQDDHAHELVAHGHRDGQHRLEDVVGAGDRDGEVHLSRVGGEQGLPWSRRRGP